MILYAYDRLNGVMLEESSVKIHCVKEFVQS